MSAETIRPLADEDEQPRDYYFTFGAEIPALEHCFVRIHGTYMQARLKMIAAHGQLWCSQYESAEDAGVERYHLTELVLPDSSTETR
jgi:hypothetical protein